MMEEVIEEETMVVSPPPKVNWKQALQPGAGSAEGGKKKNSGKTKVGKGKQEKTEKKEVDRNDLFGSSEGDEDPDEMESEDNASDASHDYSSTESESSGSEPPLASDDEEDDFIDKPARKSSKPVPSEPTMDKVEEARRDFDRALERVKSASGGRRSTLGGGGDSEAVDLDEMAQAIRIQMDLALEKDLQCLEAGEGALHRLKLLPWVRDQLGKRHLHEVILENGCLEAIRRWLEPLPNRQMPTPNLRQALLECLGALPISTGQLKEARLGPIVLFQAQREGELPEIKRLANQLIMEWSRPIVEAANRRQLPSADNDDNPNMTVSHRQAPRQLQSEAFKQRNHPQAKQDPHHKIIAHLQKKSRKK